MSTLTDEEYLERKKCLEELKTLVKSEQAQIFRILKKYKVEYTENSSGILFDLTKVSKEAFDEIQSFLLFCQDNRNEFEERDRKMEISRLNLGDLSSLG
jgi:hypothetical protein